MHIRLLPKEIFLVVKPILFVLIITLVMFSASCKANGWLSSIPDRATEFKLETLDGEEIALSEVLKEKRAVLLFWTTWCFYCRQELPRAKRFYIQNKDKVAVIGIAVGESKAKVENSLRKTELFYPIALDLDGSVAQAYSVRGVPTIVAVDKDKKILYYGHSIEELADRVDF